MRIMSFYSYNGNGEIAVGETGVGELSVREMV